MVVFKMDEEFRGCAVTFDSTHIWMATVWNGQENGQRKGGASCLMLILASLATLPLGMAQPSQDCF